MYLPHLRNAVYQHLIAADNLLDAAEGRGLADGDQPWVELTSDDYNFDGRQEVRLASNRLIALVAPAHGGQLYELDVRAICHNLLATLTRREEAYHARSAAASRRPTATSPAFTTASSSSRQASTSGCSTTVTAARACSITSIDSTRRSTRSPRASTQELGDFVDGPYEAKLRRNPDRMQVQLTRDGRVGDRPVRITKGVTLEAGEQTLEIAYLLEGLPPGEPLHFGVEFNFAGLPVRRRRPLLPRRPRQVARPARHAARPGERRRPRPHRRMARHRRRAASSTGRCTSGPSRSKRSANRKAASSWCINRSSCSRTGIIDGRRRRPLERTTMTLAIDTSAAEKRRTVDRRSDRASA